MSVFSLPIGLLVGLDLLLLVLLVLLLQRRFTNSSQHEALTRLTGQIEALQTALSGQLSVAVGDMAGRLEQTKGDLRQQVSDRLEGADKQYRDPRGNLLSC